MANFVKPDFLRMLLTLPFATALILPAASWSAIGAAPCTRAVLWPRATATGRASPVRLQSLFSDDGGEAEVDWDKEALALSAPQNEYVRALKGMKLPDMVAEFAATAPEGVQIAVKQTVAQLLGRLPTEVCGLTCSMYSTWTPPELSY